MNPNGFVVGERVWLVHDVDRYPSFIAGRGMRGTVVVSDDFMLAVKMDDRIEGAEEWDNEVHWYHHDVPWADLQTLAIRWRPE